MAAVGGLIDGGLSMPKSSLLPRFVPVRLDTKKPLGVVEGRRGAVRAGYFFAGTNSNTRA